MTIKCGYDEVYTVTITYCIYDIWVYQIFGYKDYNDLTVTSLE